MRITISEDELDALVDALWFSLNADLDVWDPLDIDSSEKAFLIRKLYYRLNDKAESL